MNVILVSGKLARAKTFSLGLPHFLLLGLGLALTALMLAAILHYVALRFADDVKLPYVESTVLAAQERQYALQQQQHEKAQSYLRANLNAMAVKLGEMQAQLVRLDTVGERLAKLAGIKPQDMMFGERPGRGGAVSTLPSQDLSLGDFTQELELLTRQVDDRSDKLGILESLFTVDSANKKLIPTMRPVEGGWYSSNFGWRIDPFTGQRAFHTGIDVMAEKGTPIYAAAGGVVIFSGRHRQYGNMIEIDHGNGLITRYAHASKLLVNVGDLVVRGVQVGKVGKTGRATGSHLHFEVRRRGAPVNPKRFLRLPG
ncbi:MAG: M23 family metallopeptidase [Betaproteobacteria bacterium]|nr:M23 family metallopeptidase [Betaproteobacteria bacterium]MDH3438631.1 M23 family metallopeptidase [Betaproteobacteria bacterium]